MKKFKAAGKSLIEGFKKNEFNMSQALILTGALMIVIATILYIIDPTIINR